MTRFFLLLLLAVIFVPAAVAQDRGYTRYEFYGGYAYQRADNNADTIDRNGLGGQIVLGHQDKSYNGFTAEFNQNLNRHVGIVTSFTATSDNSPYVNTVNGNSFAVNVHRYDLLFGPRFNLRTSAVTPFAEALFGFEHMNVKFTNANLVNVVTSPTAFAMAFGGGLDIHAGDHIDIRAIQGDYLPTFYNSTHQNNYRLGAGIKVKFGQVQ